MNRLVDRLLSLPLLAIAIACVMHAYPLLAIGAESLAKSGGVRSFSCRGNGWRAKRAASAASFNPASQPAPDDAEM